MSCTKCTKPILEKTEQVLMDTSTQNEQYDEPSRIVDKKRNTLAHLLAEKGELRAPYASKLWRLRNKYGETPAHWAAENGHLRAPYESDLWRTQTKYGHTPAHEAAKNGYLQAPYESDLWRIQDVYGETPAHWAAEKGCLLAPYDSDLWRIPDRSGWTPAHWAAEKGYLQAPYESDLWRIPDDTGKTPAHLAVEWGNFKAPYYYDLWFIKDTDGYTPAHYIDEFFVILLNQTNKIIIKNCSIQDVNMKPTNIWDVLGGIRLTILFKSSADVTIKVEELRDLFRKTELPSPDLCNYRLVFKHITDLPLFLSIRKNQPLLDIYCRTMAGAVAMIKTKNPDLAKDILFKSTNPYTDNSLSGTLKELGIWNVVKDYANNMFGAEIE